MFENKNIILASGSPRRKLLLEQAEVSFTVKTASVVEDFPEDMAPEEVPVFLACKKADAVSKECMENELILAADTIVLLGDAILGKPLNKLDAVHSLRKLSGQSHKVITGVCLKKGAQQETFSVCTKVYFKHLSEDWISHYVNHYHPFDKAGAYGIQEWIGLVGIDRIEGDYFNVVGLPVSRVLEELTKL